MSCGFTREELSATEASNLLVLRRRVIFYALRRVVEAVRRKGRSIKIMKFLERLDDEEVSRIRWSMFIIRSSDFGDFHCEGMQKGVWNGI